MRLSKIETEGSPNLYLGPELNLDLSLNLPRNLDLTLSFSLNEASNLFDRHAADEEITLRRDNEWNPGLACCVPGRFPFLSYLATLFIDRTLTLRRASSLLDQLTEHRRIRNVSAFTPEGPIRLTHKRHPM